MTLTYPIGSKTPGALRELRWLGLPCGSERPENFGVKGRIARGKKTPPENHAIIRPGKRAYYSPRFPDTWDQRRDIPRLHDRINGGMKHSPCDKGMLKAIADESYSPGR